MERFLIFWCLMMNYSMAETNMVSLDIELTGPRNLSGVQPCKGEFNRDIKLVQKEDENGQSNSRWTTLNNKIAFPPPMSLRSIFFSNKVRLSLMLEDAHANSCCVKHFIPKCRVGTKQTMLFCRNDTLLSNFNPQAIGGAVRQWTRSRVRNSLNCSSSESQTVMEIRRACESQFMDNTYGDEVDSDTLFKSLYNFRKNLCVGTIALNILKGLRKSTTKARMSKSNYEVVVGTLDSIFETNFSANWQNRSNSDTKEIVEATEELLNHLAQDRKNYTEDLLFDERNIVYKAVKLNTSSQASLLFPNEQEKENSTLLQQASVHFSLANSENKDCNITIAVGIVSSRYPKYIQETVREKNPNDDRQPVSVLLSLVVLNSDDSDDNCVNFTHNPIRLLFTPIMEIQKNTHCEGNFLRITNDSLDWDNDSLTTSCSQSGGPIEVYTTHLTSFAVLVSPTGEFDDTLNKPHQEALNVVSYIGCVISIVSLILTITCLLIFRKKLNKGVLLHIHVNLAISLLLGLLFFALGVDLASDIEVLCKVIAALIQYFFLCAFLWMLGEGVMLYILLVKVFGNLADKWYLLIPICWGIPIPIVAISAGIQHSEYLATDDNGTYLYCWIKANPSEPAIWTFVGPIILIICMTWLFSEKSLKQGWPRWISGLLDVPINAVILFLTVGSIIKTRLYVSTITEKNSSKMELVKVTVKGSVILLPLLGLTWLLGIFAVNSNTVVFAWLFTVMNSLQGFFIFIIHVLRNDYIWGKLKSTLRIRKIKERLSSSQLVTFSTRNGTDIMCNGESASQIASSSTSCDIKSTEDGKTDGNK